MTTTANETLVDLYIERAIDLLRLEAGTRNKVFALLDDLEKEIVKAIAAIDPSGPARLAYQRLRLQKLLDHVNASIRAGYRSNNSLMASEIREVVDAEAVWTGTAINSAIRVDFVDTVLPRQFLDTLVSDVLIQGASSRDWWQRQAAGLAGKFADEMRRGMALGENNDQLMKRVRGAGGVMQLARNSAERLVRASVQAAANTAREAVYNDNSDIIEKVDWHATLDTRTSEWCIVRDGLSYTPTDHKPIGHNVPWLEGPGKLHWGCRSSSIPVLKSWESLGIDADEVPETTRASMDGQTAADTSFESWLKRQGRERQDTVLGATKADLWRTGKITFRDLLDQNGRPLTTEQIRAKAAE